jgi:hypothetical protein
MKTTGLAFLVLLSGLGPVRADESLVPFVIPSEVGKESRIAFPPGPAIAPDGPRVLARAGHFWLGDRRFRVWGVNTCFGANLLPHEEATRVAARLAAFGINCVRIHHLDTRPYPGGIWDPKKPMEFSADALDRLDFFIDQLARYGIRVNLNLHVGREHSHLLGLPPGGAARDYDKMVDLFTQQLGEAQREYARRLLGHVNAYRSVRYADDAAIAFVEINNEDSLFMWGAAQRLPQLPAFYADLLRARYQDFLRRRYGDMPKLRAAWDVGAEPLGTNVLSAIGARRTQDRPGWNLEQHEGCRASVAAPTSATGRGAPGSTIRIEIAQNDATRWHIQYNCGGAKLTAGRYYTVTFRARADQTREIEYSIGQAHAPWKGLGLSQSAPLDPEWRSFRAGFAATESDYNARLSFLLAGSDTAVELADAVLAPGGMIGLGEDESLEAGNVAVFPHTATALRQIDAIAFLAQTEKDFYDGMYAVMKDELGCKALVTGTIVFGPASLYSLSGMDYLDAHAYWQHPHFPGRPWDPANWLIEQEAMVEHPEQAPLFGLAAARLAGKPFTVSEYNHPAPNDFQAECVPLIASFAAAQDWDGVWLFSYLHRPGPVDRDYFDSFFDIDANPAKWGFVPAGAAVFRDAAVKPLANQTVVSLTGQKDPLNDLARLQMRHQSVWSAVKEKGPLRWEDVLKARLYVTCGQAATMPAAMESATPATTIAWEGDAAGHCHYHLRSKNAEVFVGHSKSESGPAGGYLESITEPNFAALTLSALDGKPLSESNKLLLTACGRCENSSMQFSTDRRTVGTHWGQGPVCIEPVGGHIRLPSSSLSCRVLSPAGEEEQTIETRDGGLDLLPSYRTMWYLLQRP